MKRLSIWLLILGLLTLVSACEEEQIITDNAQLLISFMDIPENSVWGNCYALDSPASIGNNYFAFLCFFHADYLPYGEQLIVVASLNFYGDDLKFISPAIQCDSPGADWEGYWEGHRLNSTPDGRYLLISVVCDYYVYLYLLDSSTGQLTEIIPQEDHLIGSDASISPDGQWIAYTSLDGLWKMKIDGGEPILLIATDYETDYTYIDYPSWSPDGNQLAFVFNEPTSDDDRYQSSVCTVPIAGGVFQRLVLGAIEPYWSSDGKSIAFISLPYLWGNKAVYIARLDEDNPIQVTWPPLFDYMGPPPVDDGDSLPCWSPDGQWIIFRSDVREDPSGITPPSLWKINVNESGN